MGRHRSSGFRNTTLGDGLIRAMAEGKIVQPGRETKMALLEVQDMERLERQERRKRIVDRVTTEARHPVAEGQEDPAITAYNLITNYATLERKVNEAVKELIGAFRSAAHGVERSKRWGGQNIQAFEHLGGEPLDSAKRFERFAHSVVKKIEDIISEGNKRPSGMIGQR